MTDPVLSAAGRSARTAPPIDARDRAVPLYDVASLRQIEAQATRSLPARTLMARAGRAAAAVLLDNEVPVHAAWIAVGPGNNGGDALVAACELRRAGVRVHACMPREVVPDDARWALQLAREAGVPIGTTIPDTLQGFDWALDGLFGIGLGRPLDGEFARIAALLSEHARQGARVLALDVPSGLDSDTGNVAHDGAAVRATDTITFIGAKPGLYMAHGPDLAGRVCIAPLELTAALTTPAGLPPFDVPRLNAPTLFASRLPERALASHKGTFGTLAVLGGATGMGGAPLLAARAALYCGAGKIHVGLLDDGVPPYDPVHPELMLSSIHTLALDATSALAIGPGMGRDERAARVLADVLSLNVPIVVDADALNLLAHDASLAARLAGRQAATIITPHPLEAARLLGVDAASVQRDRLGAARRLAERLNAVVVLKGNGTVIAGARDPSHRPLTINPTGNAALATGGTGDVLCGMIGAFAAQRMPPYEAALTAVYLHGAAAESLCADGDGPAGCTAGELAPRVRRLLNTRFYTR
ncbi:Nitric-oxide reductase subunit C (EC 1.7.99.7) [Mycetohabitans rhizoxinica HKI 454]|uniref:Bifunctional NAD(P)H-hydrate repair enzyme n=1 Tax=Mycetohabitans rhizoxinica (strain DSM 19002 / CIP 109453 / HKI 454) TaxID=882378 RepID=E5ARF9_MYCRK|nr:MULTISPECIES: NAD(P)H-hydrate dehydratase [Mycetohabitans]MCF7695908.1 NAD(P)H-hydrate dehydratase [Mycetohabitans sp. B2]MCG1047245.1 NAD(P)H-hydrate dehydratase [Mycetohabitans sp. B6]CBW75191.1 Nitric-oxide reductase subunit C (EC 1.7.99.7) [Mycetohabitans rhizoxinica HKI 454]